MSLVDWIILAVVGRLLSFTLRKSLLPVVTNKYLHELLDCWFCLGVWVYSALALMFRADILGGYMTNIPIINNIITGVVTSFLVWIFSDGWKARFEVIKI